MINSLSIKKSLSMVLSLVVALSISNVSLAKTNFSSIKDTNLINKHSLVTLGDSITFGYGLENQNKVHSKKAYPQLLADELQFKVDNMSVSGITSAELLNKIKNNKSYIDAIANAGIITLNIGGNDMLRYLMKLNYSSLDINDMLDKLQTIAQDYSTNLGNILEEIRNLNAEAPIFQYGFYNPLHDLHPTALAIKANLSKIGYAAFYKNMNFLIKSINKITYTNYIKKFDKLYYVNVFKEFEKYSKTNPKANLFCDKVHPSETGQKLLKDAAYKVISTKVVSNITAS